VAPFGWEGATDRFERVYGRILGFSVRRIGPVNVDVLDRTSATAAILGSAARQEPKLVTFCNAHTVNLANRDPRLREALARATVLNDGVGLDMASRALFGASFPQNLNGTDFVPHVLASAETALRVYLVGGACDVAEAAGRELCRRNPALQVVGTTHGYFEDRESDAIVEAIRRSGANLVLVAMGQPRQEIWAAQHFREIAGPTICVGALLDFLAGRVPRAPLWIRERRIEWAFRLMKEPRRLTRRYVIGNAAFLARTMGQKWFATRL
jgi:alpha-1,3-mannosyltransferase